jgi:hypothetical protein
VQTRQFTSFGLWSRRMSASEMAARIGLDPDEISVRCADLVDPPVPSAHEWTFTCRDAVTLDEQVELLVARLSPYAEQIGELAQHLATDHSGGARLRIVRTVGVPDGPDTDTGWRLDRRVMRFLEDTHADVRVDDRGL